MLKMILPVVMCLVVGSIFQPSLAQPTPPTDVADASLTFSWNAYRALKVNSSQNVLFSPYSVTNALSMLVLGSTGLTQQRLLTALAIPRNLDTQQLYTQLQAENNKLSTADGITFAYGNQFFVSDNLTNKVNPHFAARLQQYFDAAVDPAPFKEDPNDARDIINNYVSNKTNNEISQFLDENLPTDTILALVNAIFFHGNWAKAFNPNNTQKAMFHTLSCGEVEADFMRLVEETSLPYNECEDSDCQLTSLSYASGDGNSQYEMVFIVSNKDNITLDDIVARLDAQTLRALWHGATATNVIFEMPKFSWINRYSLKDVLGTLGAAAIFGAPAAGDSIIFTDNEGLLIDDVIHEAKITVDEQGTTATGTTSITGALTRFDVAGGPVLPPKYVTLDRPFLFFVADKSNDFILFWGHIADPTLTVGVELGGVQVCPSD